MDSETLFHKPVISILSHALQHAQNYGFDIFQNERQHKNTVFMVFLFFKQSY